MDRALAARATVVSAGERLVLAPDLAGAVAHGVDPTLYERDLQDARRRAITSRCGSCSWSIDHAGWVVALHSPEDQDFSGKTLEEGLAWCLVWLMAPDLGVGPFLDLWRSFHQQRDSQVPARPVGGAEIDILIDASHRSIGAALYQNRVCIASGGCNVGLSCAPYTAPGSATGSLIRLIFTMS